MVLPICKYNCFYSYSRNGETNPDYRLNCQPSCGKKQRTDARQTLSKDQLDREDILYIVTTSGTARPLPRVVYATKSSVQPNIDDLRSVPGFLTFLQTCLLE